MPGLHLEPLRDDHFILGSGKLSARFGGTPLMPDGHGWGKYVPLEEPQSQYGFETMDCSVFGTLKSLITLANFLGFTASGWPNDCSQRYNGIMAGTTPTGNSPHLVIENIRTQAGVVAQQALPWTPDLNTWAKYYAPKPLPTSLVAMGQVILKHFDIGHEWVFNGGNPDRPTLLKQALARGPVSASVYAWRENAQGLYFKEATDEDEHWVQIVDYVEGQYWEISDQYFPYRKHLVWDYPFQEAKLYALSQKSPVTTSDLQTVLSLIFMNVQQLAKIILARITPAPVTTNQTSMESKIYSTLLTSLGKHMTLNESVDPELGCAEAWSAVAKLAGVAGIPPQGFAGTIALAAWLATNPNFERIQAPEPGATIISVTEGAKHGHVGFFGAYGTQYNGDWGICSNDSSTGFFREQWNYKQWLAYYGGELGLQTLIYRAK